MSLSLHDYNAKIEDCYTHQCSTHAYDASLDLGQFDIKQLS